MSQKYNPYEDENPNDFNYHPEETEPESGGNRYENEFEKEIGTIHKLGVASVIAGVLLMCCCGLFSLVTGVIGLMKANAMLPYMEQFSTETQERLKSGKKLCIIGIVLGIVSLIMMCFGGVYQAFWEGFRSGEPLYPDAVAVMLWG